MAEITRDSFIADRPCVSGRRANIELFYLCHEERRKERIFDINKLEGGLLLFDGNKIKMTRKSGKKQKENPVGCTGEGK